MMQQTNARRSTCSSSLPPHGRVVCTLCHNNKPFVFDVTQTISSDSEWRITANPLAWGNQEAEIVILGFSKGPTQSGDLARIPHDLVAFKGGRANLGKILAHVGLLPISDNAALTKAVDGLIADRSGRFHFGSLVRCTVEQNHRRNGWIKTGGDMLGGFVSSAFGKAVVSNCTSRFLGALPSQTRLVLMLGLGNKGNYVSAARKAIEAACGTQMKTINAVSYTNGIVTFVHVEHFKSQGSLIGDWMDDTHVRGRIYGAAAREAVGAVFSTA